MPKDAYADVQADLQRYELDPNWHGPVYAAARGKPGQDSYYSFFIGRMEKRPGADYYRDHDWACVMEALRFMFDAVYLAIGSADGPVAVDLHYYNTARRAGHWRHGRVRARTGGADRAARPLSRNRRCRGAVLARHPPNRPRPFSRP